MKKTKREWINGTILIAALFAPFILCGAIIDLLVNNPEPRNISTAIALLCIFAMQKADRIVDRYRRSDEKPEQDGKELR